MNSLCSAKKHPLMFSFHLRGRCLDFHKNFRKCLGGNYYSTGIQVRCSLLLETSCWRHISAFVNYESNHWRQTSDKMFASQQGLCSRKFVLHVSGQCTDNGILMEWNFSIKKLTWPAVSSRLTYSGQVVIHAVAEFAYACQHQQSWGSRTQPRR